MINRIFSLLILIMLLPLFLLIGLIIIVDDGFPILFKQKRVGQKNSHFLIYKFRTMKKGTPDIPTHLLNNQNLYTISGPFLRKFSFDELPQLVNIIKGEIKFIGPRPALYNQDDLIKLRSEKGIHNIKPGITGWSQVNGRDNLSIIEKVKLDEYYYNNKSVFLDLKIIIKTITQIFSPKGIKK
tara:strand:+ start:3289 stop:3837 length:549 start_codon:yes stop_codon:yes gene_type:complete